ncbi:MAG: AAA family ATPase [Nitrospirae bacterium]|nr:AAA family ATPase [Nitrospirota bacterium]
MKNILITGRPATGKTTLVKRLWTRFQDHHPVGFYTEEIREHDSRVGFRIVSFLGHRITLAHKDLNTPYRVSRYSVDLEAFERFLIDLEPHLKRANFVIIDEIGKMECFSKYFISLTRKLLDSEKIVVATVSLKGGGLIEEVKHRVDSQLFEINDKTRDLIFTEIARVLQEILSTNMLN